MTAGWSIALHAGAGPARREDIPPEREAAYRAGLRAALDIGAAILAGGGTALDAVQATVEALEDDPWFNAGRGSVFTADGRIEMDAAIMDGASLNAGAAAGLVRVRHPIALARAVMDQSPHVMLIGPAAEAFAAERGLEQVDAASFFTELAWQGLVRTLTEQGLPIPPRPAGAPPEPRDPSPTSDAAAVDHRHGTVGAVARDARGHLAAATSTGGMTAKRAGRVGDTPIIGAGTYASDASCAVSGTGSGEHFIRLTLARAIAALVEHRGVPLRAAADALIHVQLPALGGVGGVIALAPDGQAAWSFNTPSMLRARVATGQNPVISIFEGED